MEVQKITHKQVVWAMKDYKYQDWNHLFENSEANTELGFLAEIIITRNSLRYVQLLDEI